MQKIVLADNQAIFRAGMARILAVEGDIQIVAQVGDLDRLMSSIQTFRGATILFSTGLKPDLNAVAAALAETGGRGILIAEKAEPIAESVISALSGIILRNVTAAELVEATRRVKQGLRVAVLPQTLVLQNQDAVGTRVRDRLTPKEMQIVALIVQGCKNKQIALQLATKEQVIKNYLRSIYDKTGVSDRLELALFTLHHRILAEAAAKAGSLLERRTA